MISPKMVPLCTVILVSSALATLHAQPIQAPAPHSELPKLRDLAKKRHLNFGTAMPMRAIKSNADEGKYTSSAESLFNMLELENELKPPAIWTGPHEYHFSDIDFVLGEPGKKGWAQQHKFKFRGHVLVYARDDGYTVPDWLRKSGPDMPKEDAKLLLHDYIFALAGRYRGKIAMWDVANEAISDGPNDNQFNLRNSFWFKKLGPEFLVLAFKWAHEADPKAELYYNEYGFEGGGPKAKHVLDLVKWLKEQGAPITGVGMQYHIDCRTSITPGDGHYTLLEDIRKLGLSFMVTELDVAVPVKSLPFRDPDRGVIPVNPTDLDLQAKTYAAVLQMALSSRHCHGVNIWGLTDRYSWIPFASGGRDGAATLLTKNYEPKAAVAAVEAVLKR